MWRSNEAMFAYTPIILVYHFALVTIFTQPKTMRITIVMLLAGHVTLYVLAIACQPQSDFHISRLLNGRFIDYEHFVCHFQSYYYISVLCILLWSVWISIIIKCICVFALTVYTNVLIAYYMLCCIHCWLLAGISLDIICFCFVYAPLFMYIDAIVPPLSLLYAPLGVVSNSYQQQEYIVFLYHRKISLWHSFVMR